MFITRLKMLLRTLENHGMPQNTHNKTCLEFLVLKFLNIAISETRNSLGHRSWKSCRSPGAGSGWDDQLHLYPEHGPKCLNSFPNFLGWSKKEEKSNHICVTSWEHELLKQTLEYGMEESRYFPRLDSKLRVQTHSTIPALQRLRQEGVHGQSHPGLHSESLSQQNKMSL